MMQPAFLPWQGLFELISKSDIFIFLDDFQFSIQSYHQRNKLFLNKGQPGWYSVPIQRKTSLKRPLSETQINYSIAWREKFWKRIHNNYSKSEFFDSISKHVRVWLFDEYVSLAEQNISFIKLVCSMINVGKEFRYSSDYVSKAKRSQRVAQLLSWCQAESYFCAKGSFEYMKEDNVFPIASTQIYFQDFVPHDYKQVGSEHKFIPYLSVLDALFNVGPQATAQLVRKGTKQWPSWEDMERKHLDHSIELDSK